MNRQRILVLAVLATITGPACSGDEPTSAPTAATAAPATPSTRPRGIDADATVMALSDAELSVGERARGLLADELGIPVSTIRVDTIRAVNWPDTSIGCPQPGVAYGQVITPGYKITLRTEDGGVHVVHSAKGQEFICKRSKKSPAELTPELDIVWGPQAAIARDDLAGKLRVDPKQIIIANAAKRVWGDAGMDCPEAGTQYPQARTEGYVLTLRHGSRNFTYHTDLDRVVACPEFSED